MGLFGGLLGNASKIDNDKIRQEFGNILTEHEKVEHAYQMIRDYFVFTDKRLVLVNKQGITGSKVEYHSIPYKSITHFSIETAGHLDLDAELKIYISSQTTPIQKQFTKHLNIYDVQAVLAKYILY
ncbi:MAG: PH domain-containing protein [Janthinobacterium lividum]